MTIPAILEWSPARREQCSAVQCSAAINKIRIEKRKAKETLFLDMGDLSLTSMSKA